jgi:hypothetical protein
VKKKSKQVLGWREWCSLPQFSVKKIKAKIDTGARTSALHVSDIKYKKHSGKTFVYFRIHPLQRKSKPFYDCHSELVDYRIIKSSNGNSTFRPVLITEIKIGENEFPIEVTLVNRDLMGFRFLVGRQAIRRKFLVDSGRSFLTKKKIKPTEEDSQKKRGHE